MTLMRTAVLAADADPCDIYLQELQPLLEDATRDSGSLRPALSRAIKANDERPCICRRLPLLIAVTAEVVQPGDDSAEIVSHYRTQAAGCDPWIRLMLARLRFTALDGRAKRHLRGITLAERILGKRYNLAAFWAGLYLGVAEASMPRSGLELQRT